jgi:transcriptional regulator with XRE-family HTH domain
MSPEFNYLGAEEVGERLRAWRSGAHLTLDEMTILMHAALPRSHVLGRETLRRYEAGKVGPRQMETLILAVYATECGQRLEELGTAFTHDLERIHKLVLRCSQTTR